MPRLDHPPPQRSTPPVRNPFRTERLGGLLPFVWYGMRTGPWLRLLASGGWHVTPNRWLNAAGVTLMAPPSSLMSVVSEALYRRRAEAVEVVPPLFVLGHWRSGTSFLHNLLSLDPASAFPTTFECILPDGFLVAERWMGWALAPFLPGTRAMDAVPMGSAEPFEDEFALAKLGFPSPYADLAFPRKAPAAALDPQDLSPADRQAWEQGFVWLMRRLQLAHPGRRLVLKSPPHTARIATLLKLFPDARFVHIARDPYEIYPSTLKLWKVLNSRFGLQNPAGDDNWLPEHVLATLPRLYAPYERDLPLVPSGRLVEIRYEDLVAAPKATLRTAYSGLEIDGFGQLEPRLDAYLERLGPHLPSRYRLSTTEKEAVTSRWQGYRDRFGYAGSL